MRPLILASSLLLLVLGEVAKAEEVYLNCKFVRGDYSSPDFSSENIDKNSEFANDIGIGLNLKSSKITSLTDTNNLNTPEILKLTIAIIDWTEKKITFTYSPTNYAKYTYNLDRLSGNLRRTVDLITDTQKKIKVSSFSECSKQSKKF